MQRSTQGKPHEHHDDSTDQRTLGRGVRHLLRLRGRELCYLLPSRAILKTLVVKGLPMGLQMIVISSSALATIGLVNREGVDTTAAFGRGDTS